MSLETVIVASLKAIETSNLDLAQGRAPIELEVRHAFGSGSGANQASNAFSDSRTLAASGSENIDLAGALTTIFGVVLNFASVKAILIRARATNVNNVAVGPAASNGFLGPFADASDRVVIKPGGVFLVTAPAAGWPVTAGTGDLLTVTNLGAGSAVDYDIVIIG
ncbi:hypothetical protein IED13_15455 [Bosea sp. SSUT16]|uniref:Uncharacterized protein n=1 Tax=Bosea spartocytisi TaxID=2773451 RepID=A0A927HZ18_9HYPH|nr:hypothetical protein [Bosea spartocytisi]MBD3847105.1 hypothetical protein [Bosea spartocytisi]MCT4474199.1 hypothetical protein [Bosea spartocytisi]